MISGKVFVCGGHGSFNSTLDSCESYDTSNGQWRAEANLNVPREYFGIRKYNGHFYAIGGRQGDGVSLDRVEVYDEIVGGWNECFKEHSAGIITSRRNSID